MKTTCRVPLWSTVRQVRARQILLPILLGLGLGLGLGLAGCGGGGGGGSSGGGSGGGDTTRPPANVQAADTVPAAAQSTLRRVVSPGAAGAYGSDLALSSTAQPRPVLALDEGGRIVLAAISSGDRVVLSAESTALALVQLAYGRPLPGTTQTAQVDQIRAVAAFPALVAAVQEALASAQPPSQTASVLRQVRAVLTALADRRSQSLRSGRAFRAELARPRAEDLGTRPYEALTGWSFGAIFLPVGALSGEVLSLQNGTPLYWSAYTERLNGTSVPAGDASRDRVLIPATSFGDRALDRLVRGNPDNLLAWLLGLERHGVPAPAGDHFNLRLVQDRPALLRNFVSLLNQSIGVVQGDDPLVACEQTLVTTVAGHPRFAPFLEDPTAAGFFQLLNGSLAEILIESLDGLGGSDLRKNCLGQGSVAEATLEALKSKLRFVSALTAAIDTLDKVAGIVELADLWAWLFGALGENRLVGLCAADGRIQNCSASFRFAESTLRLAPGTTFQPEALALDSAGRELARPGVLQWSSAEPSLAVDAQTGTLTTPAAWMPDANLRVRDPATLAEGVATVVVAAAQMAPPSLSLQVAELGVLSLQDAQGRRVRHDARLVEWRSADAGVAAIDPLLNALPLGAAPPDRVAVLGLRPGRTSVEFINPFDPRGVPLRAQVVVQGGQPSGTLVSSPNPSAADAPVRFSVRALPVPDEPLVPRPTGRVVLRDGDGQPVCSLDLDVDGRGSCEGAWAGPPRLVEVIADYAGDDIFLPRAGLAQTVHAIGLLASNVTIEASEQARLGETVELTAWVRTASTAPDAPAPEGDVQLSLGVQRCSAALVAQSAGAARARCAVLAIEQGLQVPLQADYSGDARHAATTASGYTAVGRGLALVQAQASPTTVSDGATVGWDFRVTLPTVSGITATGQVSVRTGPQAEPPGQLLCQADLGSAGQGSCSGVLGNGPFGSYPAGPLPVVVSYSGDARLLPAQTTVTLDRVLPRPEPGAWFTSERSSCLSGPFDGCAVYGRSIEAYIHCETRHLCLQGARLEVTQEVLTYPNGVRTTETVRYRVDAGELSYFTRAPNDPTAGVGTYRMPIQPLVWERANLAFSTIYRGGFSAYPIKTSDGLPGYEATAVTIEILDANGALVFTRTVDGRRSRVQDCGLFVGAFGGPGQLCVEALPYP